MSMSGNQGLSKEAENDDHEEGADKTIDLCSLNLTELSIWQLENHHQTITVLNLDYNDISSLPEDFAKCVPRLKVFTAKGNSFKRLPDDFGCLTCLTDVHLCENELTILPDSVQYLVHLKCLRLMGNKLASLPEDFGELSSLEELSVEENELTKFPPTFALLANLRILEASHNKLRVLPKFLGSMHSLTHINLCHNEVETIPDSFSELEHLVVVDVSQNKLRTLPLACSSQKTLKKFFAGENMLTEFPFWLGHLPELTDLCLKENNITGNCLPDDFGTVCKKLRYLDVCGNHLTQLPESFGELESLEFAHFGSMLEELERKNYTNGNWLCQLPASFSCLTKLTKLRLDENHIQFLPNDFGCLCNLEFLNMGQNLLHDLPESFGDLCNLRVCMLSRNNIQLLPSSFGKLSALEELLIDNNLLAELPESFVQLTQLKVLDLFHNMLTELPDCLQHFTNLQFLDLNHNPLKMPKKLVPRLRKNIEYKPRSQESQSDWRGRMRVGTAELVELTVNSACEGEDDGDELADEPVDEVYGSEDLLYNLRFLRSPDLKPLTTWRTHSGPKTRPIFFRPSHRVEPREIPISESEDEKDSSSCADGSEHEEEQSDGSCCADAAGADEIRDLTNQEDDWDKDGPDAVAFEKESWETSPPYRPVQSEENWEEEISASNASVPYSGEDLLVPHSSPFCYNPQLNGFFFVPSDVHAVQPTLRPRLHDPHYTEPEPVQGQFSDTDS